MFPFPDEVEMNNYHSIEVTGKSRATAGIYLKTNESAEAAPNNPVWKHERRNRYIFNTGSSAGWRIGKKDHLSSGKFYYKSNFI